MKGYEEFLEKYCENKTFSHRTGDVHPIGLPLKIRIKKWLLERKGYLVKVTLEYHYYSNYPPVYKTSAKGFGLARIYKYLPADPDSSIELESSTEM